MRELERILQEGFDRIDKAVDEVKRKYDFMLWGDGLCDDTPIIQRHLDEVGRLELPEGEFATYSTLNVTGNRHLKGAGVGKTKIIARV